MGDFEDKLSKIKGICVYKNASVKNDNFLKIDTTFEYKIVINNAYSIRELFNLIKLYNKKYYVLGKGSNVLFVKDYYEGILIKLNLNYKNRIKDVVYASDNINYLNNLYLKNGISTFNFLTLVPSTLGGAIYMNAGAFNHEMKDVIEYVSFYDIDEEKFKVFNNNECQFSYRDSYFKHHNCIIISAKIKIIYKDKELLMQEHNNYIDIRKNKLPLSYPSLGSVFKNPNGEYAGKLIEELGLKGYRYSNFKVSDKHANVIIKLGEAKGEDFLKLMEIINERIYEKHKRYLEPEIIIFK